MSISVSDELQLFAQEIQSFLSPNILRTLARDVGFVQRTSKYQAKDFVALCVWMNQNVATTSLTQLSSCLEESYYNKSIITYLNKEIVTESIFNYITEGLGLRVGFADSYIHVGKLNKEEAGYLDLENGSPKLYDEGIFHLTNGQPFNFSKVTYNYEQSQFFIQTNSHFL
ncbi:UTRA domain-containing protein [Bacillus mycoides]|uniref:UTRA domain-containing protein n=1 Tax=Bacillus mycoides TaxID=1405 RepID=UPI002E22014B|nr:UTRA domain-containing protein [Bacillus mycoides]MED1022690.1 UTRA domain-containing protein [Bacillus mycoides]